MNTLGAKYEESSLVCGFYHCLQSWLQHAALLLPQEPRDAFIQNMPLQPSLGTPQCRPIFPASSSFTTSEVVCKGTTRGSLHSIFIQFLREANTKNQPTMGQTIGLLSLGCCPLLVEVKAALCQSFWNAACSNQGAPVSMFNTLYSIMGLLYKTLSTFLLAMLFQLPQLTRSAVSIHKEAEAEQV